MYPRINCRLTMTNLCWGTYWTLKVGFSPPNWVFSIHMSQRLKIKGFY